MKRSEQINELATAMAKAQAEIGNAHKDTKNPFFKTNYADLASIWDACRAPLSKHGLAVVQSLSADGPSVTCTTLLMHSSGQWIESVLTMTAKDASPQSLGSAATYSRRYSLQAVATVAPADDDAEAAIPPRANTDDRAAAPKTKGSNGATKPIDPPKPREMSEAFKQFTAGIRGLMERDGNETTPESRRMFVERLCTARGIKMDELWTCDGDQFAALLVTADDLLTPEGATV